VTSFEDHREPPQRFHGDENGDENGGFFSSKNGEFLTTTGELTDRNWDVTEKWWIGMEIRDQI